MLGVSIPGVGPIGATHTICGKLYPTATCAKLHLNPNGH